MRKINSSGGKLLATALVMVTLLCATRLNTDYTSASQAELGQGVLISTPVQTNNSMSNLQAGIFDWKVWEYVGDFAEKVAKPVGQVAKAVSNVGDAWKYVKGIIPAVASLSDTQQQTRTAMLMSSLDQ